MMRTVWQVRRCLLLTIMGALTALAQTAAGAIYYVSPHGNDGNPGTEALPWATLRKAAASVQPGDTVRILAGDYFEPSGWNVNRAGTAEKPIIYQAYGNGEVRISPATTVPAGAWTQVKGCIYAAQVKPAPAYVFQDAYPLHPPGDRGKIYAVEDMFPNSFFVDGPTLYVWLGDGSHPKDSVIRITTAHVVELRDCHYTIFDGLTLEYGFNGFKDQGKATHHVTYRNCTIRSIGSQGIQPVPQDSVIERNLFQKIGSNKWQHGIYNSKPGLIVRNNIFEEIAGAAIHQFHEGSPAGGRCEFVGNVFRKPRPMTLRPGAGGRPYYVEIIAWGEGNNRIASNIFYGDGKRGGISLNSFNNRVTDNTFAGSAYGIEFHTGKTGNEVVRNIFLNAASMFLVWPAKALPQILDSNVYYNTTAPPRWQHDGKMYQTFEAYQNASGETHARYETSRVPDAPDAGPSTRSLRSTGSSPAPLSSLKPGDVFSLAGCKYVLAKLDALPYVENDYTRRFRFDDYENPKLKLLREKYYLDDRVAGGKDEFERQVLLLDWVNHRFKKFGRPTSQARGALDILEANDTGHTFFCAHYADVFVSAAASLGWVARPLALRRPDTMGSGATEHSSTEIWSNQYRKWIMFDPTFAMYVEKNGVPLNAFELRQEWFYRDGRDLVFVLDKDGKRYRKSDLPVFRSRHAGFGDLSLDAAALNVYAFIGYVPNTNLMDGGPDYGRMFITQDKLCDGTRWHKRDVPADPAGEPYFPIGQAALSLAPDGDAVRVSVKTLTPNFATYRARIDSGEWKPVADTFRWTPRADSILEVQTVNKFGVEGPVSTAEIRAAE